jgi:hypothetical protein
MQQLCSFLLAVLMSLLALTPFSAAAQEREGTTQPASIVKRIDPTDFTTRLEFRNQLRSLQHVKEKNITYPRLDYAFSKIFMARLEIRMVYVNPDIQGVGSETGLGDVLIRGAVRAARGKGYAVVAGTELIFDTATEEILGTGKYQLAPLVFASIDVPFLRSTLYPFYQHYFSFAGDGSRLDVHYNSFRPSVIVTKWGHRWYTALDPNFYVDFEQGPDAGMTLELEAGRGLNKNFSVWARPGIGAFGDIHQVYEWNVEVGMRYLFQ